jgi:8-oxo-dGTP diphosphatase
MTDTGPARAVFFEEEHALAAASRLVSDGFTAAVVRERLAGEDDDEDHPWAVLSDAPEVVLELLVERYDGWLDLPEPPSAPARPPLDLPAGPRRRVRED